MKVLQCLTHGWYEISICQVKDYAGKELWTRESNLGNITKTTFKTLVNEACGRLPEASHHFYPPLPCAPTFLG